MDGGLHSCQGNHKYLVMRYVALLRGINVSGQKKIKMVDLKAMFEQIGFNSVSTYIQSGNVVFESDGMNSNSLEDEIKKTIAFTFGFEVPVLVKTKTEIEDILRANPYTKKEDIEAKRIYYTLLKNTPEKEALTNLVQEDYPGELFFVSENCVYLYCLNGAGKAKLNNNKIELKLKVSATTRNHRTMIKLQQMLIENQV